ncbi:MAG: glycosyltransferase family 2 protein, partial [Hasllibacter sp.]
APRPRAHVSVIMPSWNRAFAIGEAIQSVLEQSNPDWELLVCDDDSQDRTADVVHGFADPRIRYMRFPKSNGAGARNHGLRLARGDHIAYLDSDNLWHPLFLDLMLGRLAARPGETLAYASYLDTEIVGAAVTLQAVARPAFRPLQLTQRNFMDLNTLVHHRRATDWLGGFDPALPRLQDWDLALRLTSVFGALHVDRIGAFYRRSLAWGQVTRTQAGSGAQGVVAARARARLEAGAQERLALDWPVPPRAGVLGCGPLARGLGALAARVGAVTEVEAPPEALGLAVADPVLAPGLDADALARAARGGARVLGLGRGPGGTVLLPDGDPALAMPLGAVPLPPGAAPGHAARGPVLLLGPLPWGADAVGAAPMPEAEARAWAAAGEALAGRDGVLAPPRGPAESWRLAGRAVDAPPPVGLVAVAGPAAALSPWETALLAAALAAGVPLALPPETGPEAGGGLAAQALEAEAAHRLDDPATLAGDLAALHVDRDALAVLSARARVLGAAAFPRAAARERLAHALWRMLADPPRAP